MSLQLTGKIQRVFNPESGVSRAGKEWKKQEFVVETDEKFPRLVCFTLFNDKTSLIEHFSEGDEAEVFFNLESREFKGKWYHNINAWKIEKKTVEAEMPGPPPEFGPEDIPPEPAEDPSNDMPF